MHRRSFRSSEKKKGSARVTRTHTRCCYHDTAQVCLEARRSTLLSMYEMFEKKIKNFYDVNTRWIKGEMRKNKIMWLTDVKETNKKAERKERKDNKGERQ